MLNGLMESIVYSYRDPRKGMRDILSKVDRPETVAVIYGLAFCLTTIVSLIIQTAAGQGEGSALAATLSSLLTNAVVFLTLVALVWFVGKLFGGQGDILQVAVALAWHSLLTAAFTPFMLLAIQGQSGAGTLFILFVTIISIWLLANFIAEVHGFASAWRVAAVFVGGSLLVAFVMSILLAGLISAA